MKEKQPKSVDVGEISWEVFSIESLEDLCFYEAGYVGGIRIGDKVIFLLKFIVDTKISVPRFMLFNAGAEYHLPQNGTPMSKKEFNDLVRFFLGKDGWEAVTNAMFEQVKDFKPSKETSKRCKKYLASLYDSSRDDNSSTKK
ncbi:MAG: hypothetical protein ACFFE6_12125 [Candidatus Thorarchaeota archaeon]